jgi:hypothetical protein
MLMRANAAARFSTLLITVHFGTLRTDGIARSRLLYCTYCSMARVFFLVLSRCGSATRGEKGRQVWIAVDGCTCQYKVPPTVPSQAAGMDTLQRTYGTVCTPVSLNSQV